MNKHLNRVNTLNNRNNTTICLPVWLFICLLGSNSHGTLFDQKVQYNNAQAVGGVFKLAYYFISPMIGDSAIEKKWFESTKLREHEVSNWKSWN
jgi:hypothetical protein